MTVPAFPTDSGQVKKPIEAYQQPISPPFPAQQQQPIYSSVLAPKQEQTSLRREPDPSPPPLPTSQPPPIASYQQQPERTFVDELKQRNVRQQRSDFLNTNSKSR